MRVSMPGTFPTPFVITVGVPKGGDCKTWTAFNLASRLGFWGYDVVAVDSNPMHDLWKDHQTLAQQGLWPRFDVIAHDPLDSHGNQTELLDVSTERGRDFIIYDTSQYVQLRTTRWAWSYCNLMIVPVCPYAAQMPNYMEALQLYLALPAPRAPILILPSRVRVLKNSIPQRRLEDLLSFLAEQGCIVPPFKAQYQIPESETIACQDTRWIFSETLYEGKKRTLHPDLITRVDISMAWIKMEIERIYGAFPTPRLAPVSMNHRDEMLSQLTSEYTQRNSAQLERASA
jgi:cellulose biosynthesis protein BcsQ